MRSSAAASLASSSVSSLLFLAYARAAATARNIQSPDPLVSRTFHLSCTASSGLPGEFGAELARESAAARGDFNSCVWVSICVDRGLRLLSRCSLDLSEFSFGLIGETKDGKSSGFCHQGVLAALE